MFMSRYFPLSILFHDRIHAIANNSSLVIADNVSGVSDSLAIRDSFDLIWYRKLHPIDKTVDEFLSIEKSLAYLRYSYIFLCLPLLRILLVPIYDHASLCFLMAILAQVQFLNCPWFTLNWDKFLLPTNLLLQPPWQIHRRNRTKSDRRTHAQKSTRSNSATSSTVKHPSQCKNTKYHGT